MPPVCGREAKIEPMNLEALSAQVEALRPRIHRFCSRIVASVFDGEDVTQEVLMTVYQNADKYDPSRPLEPWVFRIAHRASIDWLRRNRRMAILDDTDAVPAPLYEEVRHAMRAIVHRLPPKERACIVLKDVLGFTLEETADVVESTVGGVKAALHRARQKLRSPSDDGSAVVDPARSALINRYVECFNAQDWDGVCALLHVDATLEIVSARKMHGHAAFRDTYFANHAMLDMPWQLEAAWVDGELCTVERRYIERQWIPRSVARLTVRGDKIAVVQDYMHFPYVAQDLR